VDAQCVYVYTGFQKTTNEEKELEELNEFSLGGDIYVCTGDEQTTKEKLAVKLLPGEKHGWWSSNLPDKRHRTRALVNGAVNNHPVSILMDSGANVSIMSAKFAKVVVNRNDLLCDKALKIRGLAAQKVLANTRAEVKVTLGWKVAYLFEIWIGSETGGCEIILGTDFMMSAGVMLDLHRGRLCLPDEMVIPLTHKSVPDGDSPQHQLEVRINKEVSLNHRDSFLWSIRSDQRTSNAVLWVSDYRGVYPTVIQNRQKRVTGIELTNVSGGPRQLACNSCIALWISPGHLPTLEGFVRTNSSKYEEWQVLKYEYTSAAEFEANTQQERDVVDMENSIALKRDHPSYSTPPKILSRGRDNPPSSPQCFTAIKKKEERVEAGTEEIHFGEADEKEVDEKKAVEKEAIAEEVAEVASSEVIGDTSTPFIGPPLPPNYNSSKDGDNPNDLATISEEA